MLIDFSKMHGLGNDFMVVDGVTQKVFFSNDVIKKLADRHFGIGFDQLLLVEPPYDPELDFHYRIFNADGSEVEQCGNGARCFARFVRLKGLINRDRIAVSTARGRIVLQLEGENQVTVNMGVPQFEPGKIPFRAQKAEKTYLLRAQEHTVMCGVVSMGNPHCVIEVPSVADAPVETLGAIMERHERFPRAGQCRFHGDGQCHRDQAAGVRAGLWRDPGLRYRCLCGGGDWHQSGQAQGAGHRQSAGGQADHRLEGAGPAGLYDRSRRACV